MNGYRKTEFNLTIGFVLLATLQIGYGQTHFWEPTKGPYGGTVFSLDAYTGGLLLAGTGLGAAYSTDSGMSWNSNLNLPDEVTSAVCISSQSTLFVGSDRGLYRSTDSGISWTNDSSQLGTAWIYSIKAKTDGIIFVGTSNAIYRSYDNGQTWTDVSSGLNVYSVYCFLLGDSSDTILAGTEAGVFRSSNNGGSWSRLDSLKPAGAVFSLATSPSGSLFAVATYQLFRSTDKGTRWALDTNGLQNATIDCIAADSSGKVFAGTNRGLFRSTDDGMHWTSVMPNRPVDLFEVFTLIVGSDDALLIGTNEGIYRSTDSGQTWSARITGLRKFGVRNVYALPSGLVYSVTAWGGTFSSSDLGITWSRMEPSIFNDGGGFQTFATNKHGIIFAGASGHIYRSTNGGVDWDILLVGLPPYAQILTIDFDTLGAVYASGYYGVYKSTDDGNSWSNLTSSLSPSVIAAKLYVASNDILLVSTFSWLSEIDYIHNIFRSSDHGNSWTLIKDGLGLIVDGPGVGSLAISPDGDFYVSVSASSPPTALFRSTNFGDSWFRVNFDSSIGISQMVINSEGKVFLGGNGVYRSTDKGNTWTTVVAGLRKAIVSSLALSNSGYLFAGTINGVYRSTERTTPVTESVTNIPMSHSLKQNYPNPFNPNTTIEFDLAHSEDVSLTVFDLLGCRVSTLLSGHLHAGTHKVNWTPNDLPSGIYFYQLRGGHYVNTRKLLLLR